MAFASQKGYIDNLFSVGFLTVFPESLSNFELSNLTILVGFILVVKRVDSISFEPDLGPLHNLKSLKRGSVITCLLHCFDEVLKLCVLELVSSEVNMKSFTEYISSNSLVKLFQKSPSLRICDTVENVLSHLSVLDLSSNGVSSAFAISRVSP